MSRAALATLLAALALLAAGCGGDDEDDAGSASSGGQATAPAGSGQGSGSDSGGEGGRAVAEEPSEEEREGEETVRDFYAILGEDKAGKRETDFDADAFCELMSAESREQTEAFARQATGSAEELDCPAAMRILTLRAKQTGAFKRAKRAKVIGVNAEGDRATASVRFGKGPITTIPLVREDGEWKLGASPPAE